MRDSGMGVSRLIATFVMVLLSPIVFGKAVTHWDVYSPVGYQKSPIEFKKPPESLCDLNKEIISFTCKLANKRIVSVCASRNLSPDTGYIVYRYGLPTRIELEYPKKPKNPRDLFQYSGGFSQYEGQVSLSFTNNPYKYTVFYHWYSRNNKNYYRAGVSVRNGKAIVFQKLCMDNTFYTTSRTWDPIKNQFINRFGFGSGFVFIGLHLINDEFTDRIVSGESLQ